MVALFIILMLIGFWGFIGLLVSLFILIETWRVMK